MSNTPKPSGKGRSFGILMAAVILAGMVYEAFGGGLLDGGMSSQLLVRTAEGFYTGQFPGPTDPSLVTPIERTLSPKPRFRLMTTKHIPRIARDAKLPHPFVGDCVRCHLYREGAGPGTQAITPVGKVMERISKVRKLGPPLHPNSVMPHPPAGRCIKCHDIVVKVPVRGKRRDSLWTL